MKFKLLYALIILICISSVTAAGLFSVQRSEGEILNEQQRAQLEEFFGQFKGN